MRIGIGTAFAVFILVTAASAHPPRPYIGGSGHIGSIHSIMSPPAPGQDMIATGQNYKSYGAQIEGGLAGNFWDIHTDIHYSHANDRDELNNDNSGWKSSEDWYNLRLVLGARLRLSDHAASIVKPSLGAGITYGWLKRTYQFEDWLRRPGMEPRSYTENEQRKYKGCFGWLVETGFFIVPRGHLRYSLLGRIEHYELDVSNRNTCGQFVNGANQFTAEFGIAYVLGELSR